MDTEGPLGDSAGPFGIHLGSIWDPLFLSSEFWNLCSEFWDPSSEVWDLSCLNEKVEKSIGFYIVWATLGGGPWERSVAFGVIIMPLGLGGSGSGFMSIGRP